MTKEPICKKLFEEVQFITDNLGKMEVNSFESIIKRWNEFFKYSIEIFEQDFFNLLYDFFLKLFIFHVGYTPVQILQLIFSMIKILKN